MIVSTNGLKKAQTFHLPRSPWTEESTTFAPQLPATWEACSFAAHGGGCFWRARPWLLLAGSKFCSHLLQTRELIYECRWCNVALHCYTSQYFIFGK
jgi:hypothetical protein